MAGKSYIPAQYLAIYEAADALALKEITSVELCQLYLDRVESVDDEVMAFRVIDAEKVLKAAVESDARRATGGEFSAYDGVPIALKDNLAVEGETCGCASKILENFVSPYDAEVVRRLKAQGFICFGRTNMDEFSMGSSTENSAYAKTLNPWNSAYVPGGSSGGSAAVVAAGECVASLGSDTGGSIRQPAACCGVVGLKPTYGRISRYGLVAFASSLDQIGPITSNVKDTALLLDVLAGEDAKDSTSIPGQKCGFLAGLDEETTPARIGLPKEFLAVEGLDPEVRTAFDQSIELLKSKGHEIVEVELPHTKYAIATYYIISSAEASVNLARYDGVRYGMRGDGVELLSMYNSTRDAGFGKEVKRRIVLGTFVLSSGYYLKAQKVRTLIKQDFENAFQRCDIIVSPVAPSTAFKFGEKCDPLKMYLSDIYTTSVNLAGNCAISVPNGVNTVGLPVGLQMIGPVLGEKQLLQTACHFEAAKKEADRNEI